MKMKKQLKLIEKYYPGLYELTNYEVSMYAEFDSLHEYQLSVAYRRREIKRFQKVLSNEFEDDDNSSVVSGAEG